jgi:hypothetical protein
LAARNSVLISDDTKFDALSDSVEIKILKCKIWRYERHNGHPCKLRFRFRSIGSAILHHHQVNHISVIASAELKLKKNKNLLLTAFCRTRIVMPVSPLIKNTLSSFHMDITLLSDLTDYNMIHTHTVIQR